MDWLIRRQLAPSKAAEQWKDHVKLSFTRYYNNVSMYATSWIGFIRRQLVPSKAAEQWADHAILFYSDDFTSPYIRMTYYIICYIYRQLVPSKATEQWENHVI